MCRFIQSNVKRRSRRVYAKTNGVLITFGFIQVNPDKMRPPLRLAEFGTVYRWEQSGEISGMTRVRGFTQDDAHLFITEDQIQQELLGCIELVKVIFDNLGMQNYRVRIGLRDLNSDKYVGDAKQWDKAEEACRKAAEILGVKFSEEQGEAAFYGPKIGYCQ